MPRYLVKIEGRERLVEIAEGEAGPLRVSVDGRERSVDVRAVARAASGGAASLLVVADGRVRIIDVSGAPARLTVEVGHADGEPRTVLAEVTDARAVRAAAASARAEAAGPLTLRAPIPGKVVKALVKAGDQVTSGQALLVIEAMKMENEVRAPRAARVTAVAVAEGAAVETGEELLSLG